VTSFLPDHGFAVEADGRFRRNLNASPPLPDSMYQMVIKVAVESSSIRVGETV
jgi:hypothetical protein